MCHSAWDGPLSPSSRSFPKSRLSTPWRPRGKRCISATCRSLACRGKEVLREMVVRNYQDPRAGVAFVVDYCGAICVDFWGNRTMVKVDSPVISKQEPSHRSPSLDLGLGYE